MNSTTTGCLQVKRQVILNAPADVVWALVRDFGGWDAWHPAIVTCDLIEGERNQPDTVRKLGLGGEATLVEKLLRHSDADKSCTYIIVSGVLPVLNYESTIRVEDTPDGEAQVTWTSTFDAKGVSNEDAVNVIAGVYEGGFAALQQHFSTEAGTGK